VVSDGDLHFPPPLKAIEQRCAPAVHVVSLNLKLKSNVLSVECNYLIQDVVNVIFDTRLLCTTNLSASNVRIDVPVDKK
jgi:hypothetical protein